MDEIKRAENMKYALWRSTDALCIGPTAEARGSTILERSDSVAELSELAESRIDQDHEKEYPEYPKGIRYIGLQPVQDQRTGDHHMAQQDPGKHVEFVIIEEFQGLVVTVQDEYGSAGPLTEMASQSSYQTLEDAVEEAREILREDRTETHYPGGLVIAVDADGNHVPNKAQLEKEHLTRISEIQKSQLALRFKSASASHVTLAIRASDYGKFSGSQRETLQSMGYNLSFKNNLMPNRPAVGNGLDVAQTLMDARIPFVYQMHVPGKSYEKGIEVTPGLPLDTRQKKGILEAMRLNPLQSAIVESRSSEEIPAITEERETFQRMDGRGEHPKSIVAGERVFNIGDEIETDGPTTFGKGYGGTGWTITYPDGHEIHTTNLWDGGNAGPGMIPNAVLQQDPFREPIGKERGAKLNENGDFVRDGNVLKQPAPVGINMESSVIKWTSPQAQAFLKRDAQRRITMLGGDPAEADLAGGDHLSIEGSLMGTVVMLNEGWLGVRDDNFRVHLMPFEQQSARTELESLPANSYSGSNLEKEVNIRVGPTRQVEIVVGIEAHIYEPNLLFYLEQKAARSLYQVRILNELCYGDRSASDVFEVQAILRAEPPAKDMKASIDILRAETARMDEKDALALTRRLIADNENRIRSGVSAAREYYTRKQEEHSRNTPKNGDIIAFNDSNRHAILGLAVRGITRLHDSSSPYDKMAIGVVEVEPESQRLILKDEITKRLIDVQQTGLSIGDAAIVTANPKYREFAVAPDHFVRIFEEPFRLGVRTIQKDRLAEATDVLTKNIYSHDKLGKMVEFADTREQAKLLSQNPMETVLLDSQNPYTGEKKRRIVVAQGQNMSEDVLNKDRDGVETRRWPTRPEELWVATGRPKDFISETQAKVDQSRNRNDRGRTRTMGSR